MKFDRWGYEVNTCSDACLSAINSYYLQVLSYGRKRSVILEATINDPKCVLGNILAAHFLCSSDPSRALPLIDAAKSGLEHASSYEKAVFDALYYLISPDRDDDVAVELHSKLCHVYQYECHFKEAVNFMEECARSWSSLSSFMYTHNWWHVALCYLEGRAPMEKVREVYDQHIWKELERTDAVSVEVYLNAVGLLLRVHVHGGLDMFEDRLKILAICLKDRAFWYLEWHLDILILWALSFTGEFAAAENLLEGLKSRISTMNKKKKQLMQIGVQLAEALCEYGKGENEKALEFLGHEFNVLNCKIIGASDEQLDVFNEIWISLLLSTGQASRAIQAIEKQLKKRERAPFLWCLLEKGYSILGRPEAARFRDKARMLDVSHFI
ncbi:unnamed protein product [Fraxinus pennsylvanica]|uniref:Tetratricopeptide repeat protein 38 n=1 Tax=Fraxinus pennsylvanica TaxID=56036 RepID=A0AAD2E947_9LAMI|nr:unnamed protein product [Fraxinus pennsylvanica]